MYPYNTRENNVISLTREGCAGLMNCNLIHYIQNNKGGFQYET